MAFRWRFLGDRFRASSLWNAFRRKSGTNNKSSLRRYSAIGCAAAVGGVATAAGYAMVVSADDILLHPPQYPWNHNGLFDALDHKSVRRGYQVYREVCSACHSMRYVAFRHLIGVSHTEDEMKELAAEHLIPDLDDEGNESTRTGKPFDYHPDPYLNDLAARAANNGALPADLSFVVLAREGNEDYIYSYLLGYHDPPAGVEVPDEQYYNVYFPGQATSMAPPLFNDMITYEDGTPASTSQMAKDVCTFLRFTSDPKHDDRKLIGWKVEVILAILFITALYAKRHVWVGLHTRKIMSRNI